MTKLKIFIGFIVNDCSGKSLVVEIGIHWRLQFPHLKRMVFCNITLRVFELWDFDLYDWYDGGINVVVANCNM